MGDADNASDDDGSHGTSCPSIRCSSVADFVVLARRIGATSTLCGSRADGPRRNNSELLNLVFGGSIKECETEGLISQS